ncbi:hypothetical protein J7384_11985 [Endozoicomonas sp. G2_1]|uniref:hypothetical protein n=1 Tax=Endozoicomonas sp. G2_1 TaxID=2821091 RepID=UPI001ADB60E6|nr:hypothetical protein [Endozoicomonas sp. G2_1]MBO9491082.1 hypothetical protein [Endozoicomonas sp. G2_1]
MKTKLTTVIPLLALLTACGGSSDSPTPVPTPSPAPAPSPVPAPMPAPIEVPTSKYLGFESVATRPIVQDNNTLYVVNTANNSVEVFTLTEDGSHRHNLTVSVGLEPVSLALLDSKQLWVVNKLSDSVSIIDLTLAKPVVTRTLLVGDEPQDIVFAKGKAFISSAHRGQHLSHHSLRGVPGAGDPQLHTPGIGRADVWIFNTANLGQALGGIPEKIMTLFGDSPRGLAVSPDQSSVYVSVFHSGNQTTAVHEAVMCQGFEDDQLGSQPCQVMDGISSPKGLANGMLPGGRTAPGINVRGQAQPWTSMIVKYDRASGKWLDTKGRNFSNGVRFSLPDKDVFAIDTETLTEKAAYTNVGTTLFNLAVDPKTGGLFVSNTEANNAVRFEGAGEFADSTVQGNIARSQITYINTANGQVLPRHINNHIDYSQLKAKPDVKQHSLSTPTQIALSADGETLYMTALGSNKVAVLNTEQLREQKFWDGGADDFNPEQASERYLDIAGGPAGLKLDESNKRIYVYTKFDNALVTINANTGTELSRIALANPEPESFQAGRFMLYDGNRSSSNGESSCASCHIFGDTDHLSWNLGNPDEANSRNLQPFPLRHFPRLGCDLVGENDQSCQLLSIINGDGDIDTIASMKGPMATQTMRGMSTHGHMHWRGDRVNGYFGNDTEQTLDERVSFKNFIAAFDGLLGLDIGLPESVEASNKSADVKALESDMDKFADFMLAVATPPNPIRNLDNSLSDSAQLGANFFHGVRRSDGLAQDVDSNGTAVDGVNCEGCHGVDHAQGFYGSRGESGHGGEIQIFKIPQLRNLYTRVGMFGLPDREGFLPSHTKQHQGEQIRGFGFLHDGATDQLVNFLRGGVFDNGEQDCPPGVSASHGCQFNQGFVGIPDEATREGLVDYLMAFDNDIAPIVGQQVTLSATTSNVVKARLDLLHERAQVPFVSKILGGEVKECDLIAKGVIDGDYKGFLYLPASKQFASDKRTEARLSAEQLQQFAQQTGNVLTYTCAVPGQGFRLALDNDMDGRFNRD